MNCHYEYVHSILPINQSLPFWSFNWAKITTIQITMPAYTKILWQLLQVAKLKCGEHIPKDLSLGTFHISSQSISNFATFSLIFNKVSNTFTFLQVIHHHLTFHESHQYYTIQWVSHYCQNNRRLKVMTSRV